MFTGIITDIGQIKSLEQKGDLHAVIQTNLDLSSTEIGASIACAGCCLTVVEKGADWFAVDISAESLFKTTLGAWQEGSAINLETALKVGDELGGHIVSGHVDGTATLINIKAEGDSYRLLFELPEKLAIYVAPKGSIAVDGISLTVNEVEGAHFGVNIIPHTWENTTLSRLENGDKVNIEIDMLARYVARMLGKEQGA